MDIGTEVYGSWSCVIPYSQQLGLLGSSWLWTPTPEISVVGAGGAHNYRLPSCWLYRITQHRTMGWCWSHVCTAHCTLQFCGCMLHPCTSLKTIVKNTLANLQVPIIFLIYLHQVSVSTGVRPSPDVYNIIYMLRCLQINSSYPLPRYRLQNISECILVQSQFFVVQCPIS